ncbi:MAG TPA: DUF2304 domain-containing protein [Candidatus Omnitrophota bacterium]|nr:DUF2304 domain-containing protein [Candidatus Omnitrophota bacterium]HPB67650.1 DUF2304 domain-containing protein [Candidatus Omnitrophota bacterium]HQO58456.1 DUF2304 domain-containing protein [Candidatus Omnitrophota bacterium]HQP11561.1 DUF2304 domain-containing protein [Candidatus Omnitrophota bacterium]
MSVKILSSLLALLLLALIVELVRREKLTFKYAAGWLLVSLGGLILSFFDGILLAVSRFFGFELLSNFIFFAMIGVFVFLSLLLTIMLCQQNVRNDRMAQKIGLLENRLEKFEKEQSRKG